MIQHPLDTEVFKTFITTVSDPPAGAGNFSKYVPINGYSQLCSVSFQYVCDANASDRFVRLRIQRAAVNMVLGSTCFPMTAGQTWLIAGLNSAPPNSVNSEDVLYFPILDVPFLQELDMIRIDLINAQITDQASNAQMIFKTWTYEQ